ncbi:hypothetical protein BT69DRAFT_1352327 [Atractiella rhizophila]|nr:hypothetical protein BT69DRAFT_1352327 [Atractiella rhizophila]
MSGLEKSLFQLKFTTKQLQKQSAKATKDEGLQKQKLKKALQNNDTDSARIYASNAIRKKNEALNLLRLASKIEGVTGRVETAVTMRSVTKNMSQVVRSMDQAMETMNLEKITAVMDKFEAQFSDLDVQTNQMEASIGDSLATTTPQDQVDLLMQQVAEEAGLEVKHGLEESMVPDSLESAKAKEKNGEEDDLLASRLRALRPAT